MGFFQRLFGRNKEQPVVQQSEELLALFNLDKFMSSLLAGDHYVAKSEYLNVLKEKKSLVEWFVS